MQFYAIHPLLCLLAVHFRHPEIKCFLAADYMDGELFGRDFLKLAEKVVEIKASQRILILLTKEVRQPVIM